MTARKDSPEAESSSVQRSSSSSAESPGFVQPPRSAHASGALIPFDLVGVQADLDRARLEIELGHTAAAELTLSQIVAVLPRQDTSDTEVALVRASALAALGETRAASGDDGSATRHFHESVALFEKFHERLDARRECDYGIALRHVGRPVEAILALRRALAGGETSSAARLHLGLALAEVGQDDDAETELRAAAEAYPHDRRILVALAEILERHGSADAVQAYRAAVYLATEAGRLDEALALSERAVELDPNDWVSLATTGEVLRQLGRYDDALARFEQAQALAESEDPHLLASIGSTLDALGRPIEAIDVLDRAIELAPDYTFALALRGQILRALGQNEEAVATFERLLASEPGDVPTYGGLASALMDLDRIDAAESAIARGLEVDPQAPYLGLVKGQILSRTGRLDEAIRTLRAVLNDDPEYVDARVEIAETLRIDGSFDEALSHLDRALEALPESAWLLGTRGQILLGLERADEAAAALRRAVDLDPGLVWIWDALANALVVKGEYQEAVHAFDRALELGADRVDTLLLKAGALRELGAYKEELGVLHTVLEEAPDNSVALASQGQAFRLLQRDAEAIASFEAVLAKDPDATWFLDELGESLRREGRYEDALTQLERFARANGETGWNLGTKGQVLSALGRTDEAVDALRHAVELDPTLAWAHNTLGDIFVERAEYEKALASFESALAIGMETYALASKGQALRLLERYEEAIDALSQAVELDPKIAWVQAELGESLRMADRHVEGLAALDSSLELAPDDIWARASHAATLFGLERYDEAIQELDKVIEDDPSYAFAVGKRGEIRNELAEWKQAIVDLTRAIELDENSEWFQGELGWAFESDNQPSRALAAYDAALALAPDSVLWRRGRAEALRALGRPEASQEYERVLEEWEDANAEPGSGVLSVIGWCYFRLGKHEKAVRKYTNDLALDPSSVSTQFDLALALAASGRGTLAASEFERGLELAKTKPPRRRRALLVIALRNLEDAQRTAIDDASRQALAEARDALSAALTEEPTDAAAAAPR